MSTQTPVVDADPLGPLKVALDTGVLTHALESELPECRAGLQITRASVRDVRYRPGAPCWLLYQLRTRREGGASRDSYLAGRLLERGEQPSPPTGEMIARYAAISSRVFDTPFLVLREPAIALYTFPIDASMPSLFDALDPERLKVHLDRMWEARQTRVSEVSVRTLGYTPEARAAIEYRVLARSRSGEPELRRLIGKVHSKKTAARRFADAWALWRAARGRVTLAPPVGFVASLELTLQEKLDGERLGSLASDTRFPSWTRETARMLVELHALEIPLASRRRPEEDAANVHRWAGVLASVRPDLRPRIERLRDRIAAEIERRSCVSAPVHADFHHTNVLASGDGVAIIDTDEMAIGDPMLDVGRFCASLRIPSLRAFGNLDALAGAREAFLARYLESGALGDEGRARLFEAASLFVSAASAFRIQRPNWSEEVELLLGEAERVAELARERESTVVGGAAPPEASVSEELRPGQQRRWRRDGRYMQSVLVPEVASSYGAELTECRVRPRRGGSERERYTLHGWRAEEPWSLTLDGVPCRGGGGYRLPRQIEALRDALATSPEAPALPKPVTFLRSLSLLVWEPPSGARYLSLLGSSDSGPASEALGRALAALHAASVEMEVSLPPKRSWRSLRRRLRGLRSLSPGLANRATERMRLVELQTRELPELLVPTLGGLDPAHVVVGDRVGIDRVLRPRHAHPLEEAGDFLARLHRTGLERGDREHAAAAAERFRAAYLGASGMPASALAAFESGALLRLACSHAEARDLEMAGRLVEHAEGVRSGGQRPDQQREPDTLAMDPLAQVLAKQCRGTTAVHGATGTLARALSRAGVRVQRVDREDDERTHRTVVLAEALERPGADVPALLERAWRTVRSGGTLVVVVPNGDALRPPEGTARYRRRELERLLRPLAKPRTLADAPYRWLVAVVRRRREGKEASPPRSRIARYQVTAELCQGRVADLGCGQGELTGMLQERGHFVAGLELNRGKLLTVRARHRALPLLRADILHVPFADESFDSAVIAEVLEHVPEAAALGMLDEAWRLLRPGGRLIVSVPNEDMIPHPNHVQWFERRSLQKLLRRYGSPELVLDQPFKWLLMFVVKPSLPSPA